MERDCQGLAGAVPPLENGSLPARGSYKLSLCGVESQIHPVGRMFASVLGDSLEVSKRLLWEGPTAVPIARVGARCPSS
jgi:hypothetical protein